MNFFGESKFILYVTHDIFLYDEYVLLEPKDLNLTYIDFVAYFTYELHRHENNNWANSSDPLCYYINIFYNSAAITPRRWSTSNWTVTEFESIIYNENTKPLLGECDNVFPHIPKQHDFLGELNYIIAEKGMHGHHVDDLDRYITV